MFCIFFARFFFKFRIIFVGITYLLDFLFDFCLENLDLSATQQSHFEDCRTTLFVIITFYEPKLPACFLQLK